MRCLAGVLAGALAACAGPDVSCRGRVAAVLPLEPGFTMEASINGHAARLLLDTGSSANILTSSAVARLSLHTERLVDDIDVPHGFALEGVGGRRHIDRVMASAFSVGNLARQGVPFDTLWSGFAKWDVDGVLGMQTLGDYTLDIDAAAHLVTLYEPASACAEAAARYSRVVLARSGIGGPLVSVQFGGRWMLALLDTGAERSILYAPYAALPSGGHVMTADGIGPTPEEAVLLPPAPLHIGALDLPDMGVIAVRQVRPGMAELVLGLDFFRRVHVVLAPNSGTAWLGPPGQIIRILPQVTFTVRSAA